MPKARIPAINTSPPPEVLKMLGELSNEVWASLAGDISGDPDEIETAQFAWQRSFSTWRRVANSPS